MSEKLLDRIRYQFHLISVIFIDYVPVPLELICHILCMDSGSQSKVASAAEALLPIP